MYVREITSDQVLRALHLVWEVYASEEAPLQSPEAVADFQRFIKYENINSGILKGDLVLYGAWEGQELCGVSGVGRDGGLLFLSVRNPWKEQGIEELLREYPKKRKAKTIRIVAAVAAALLLLLILLAVMIYREAKAVYSSEDSSGYPFDSDGIYGDDWGFWEDDEAYGDEFEYGLEEDQLTGIDLIPEHLEDVSFEIREESYLYTPDDKKTTYVDFEIYYPQIDGLSDSGIQESVNAALESCAKESIDRIYEHPNLEIKERVLKEEYPMIADYVKYRITFLTDEYLCVVFEDYSYEGSQEASYIGLRTRNINLKDGTVYEVKDLVNLDEEFLKLWLKTMREEASDDTMLAELDPALMYQILSGRNTLDGVYTPAFFVDEEGIEIGLSFHYPKGDENDSGYGWVTAPFDLEKLRDYGIDSSFWELVQ